MKKIKSKKDDLYCIVNKNGCCNKNCPFQSMEGDYCILCECIDCNEDGTKKYNNKYKQYERTETCKNYFGA